MSSLSLIDTLTPIEVARRFGGKDSIFMVEALSETNEMLLDAVIEQASDGTINRTTQRASLPSGTRRLYNQGIATEASTSKQIEDYIEMLESYSEIDADEADHSPNKQALLESEDRAFVEGMGQTQADDLLYAQRADGPEYMNGIMCRYPTIDSVNVFGVETSGSNLTSCLLIKWAPDKCKLFYPRGESGIGLTREWRGKVDATPETGKLMPVYRTFWKVHFGISIRHPKAVKRICNIAPASTTGENLCKAIIKARNLLPPGAGNIVLYANADVKTIFDQYALTKANQFYTQKDPWGREVTMFSDNIRIRQLNALLSTESLVS